jgi:hypothetical protein
MNKFYNFKIICRTNSYKTLTILSYNELNSNHTLHIWLMSIVGYVF